MRWEGYERKLSPNWINLAQGMIHFVNTAVDLRVLSCIGGIFIKCYSGNKSLPREVRDKGLPDAS
jgi:hypothetical protein